MTLSLELTGSNKWSRLYYERHEGNPENRRIRAPYVEAFEIPFVLQRRVLAVTCTAPVNEIRASWHTGGYLTQVYSGIDLMGVSQTIPTVGGSPTVAVDGEKKRVGLNSVELVIFPLLAPQFYLFFEPVRWLKNLTFGLWEFTGAEHDSVLEQIEASRVDLARIEFKINTLL
jgi:hypothetical protein